MIKKILYGMGGNKMNKNMIERMWYLQCWSGYVEFKQIFKTEHMAKHLWESMKG